MADESSLDASGKIADFGSVELICAKEHLHANPPIGTQVQRRLEQATDEPIHRPPVIRAPVQRIVDNEQVRALLFELHVALREQPINLFGVVADIGYSRSPVGSLADRIAVFRQLPCLHGSPDHPSIVAARQELAQDGPCSDTRPACRECPNPVRSSVLALNPDRARRRPINVRTAGSCSALHQKVLPAPRMSVTTATSRCSAFKCDCGR